MNAQSPAEQKTPIYRRPGTASFMRPGNFTANHQPSCTAKQAAKFETLGRGKKRRIQFLSSMPEINQKAGGEPRSRRRAMARALAKRMQGAQA
jgi:hypothetical protein